MATNTHDDSVTLLDREKDAVQPPSLYKVILLNDDYTTMEFVLFILEEIFRKDADTAYHIMMQVHTQGKGVCGVYPKEIAELKVQQVMSLALEYEHPLKCIAEEA